MIALRDMPMISAEQKNRFREDALKVERERDALAAALEGITRAARREDLHIRGWGDQVRTAVLALGGAYGHLDRRDARAKAEALEEFCIGYDSEHEMEEHVLRHLRDAADEYRKQAEESAQ